MSGQRLLALFRRVVQEIRRDRRSVGLFLIAPILLTGLVTFILREGDTPAVDAVLVNGAGAPGVVVASALRAAVEEQGGSLEVVADETDARSMIEDETASVAVLLPAGLGTDAAATITILTNGLDPSNAKILKDMILEMKAAGKTIFITSVPYAVNKATLVERIGRNESLSDALRRIGVKPSEVDEIARALLDHYDFRRAQPGL